MKKLSCGARISSLVTVTASSLVPGAALRIIYTAGVQVTAISPLTQLVSIKSVFVFTSMTAVQLWLPFTMFTRILFE